MLPVFKLPAALVMHGRASKEAIGSVLECLYTTQYPLYKTLSGCQALQSFHIVK